MSTKVSNKVSTNVSRNVSCDMPTYMTCDMSCEVSCDMSHGLSCYFSHHLSRQVSHDMSRDKMPMTNGLIEAKKEKEFQVKDSSAIMPTAGQSCSTLILNLNANKFGLFLGKKTFL